MKHSFIWRTAMIGGSLFIAGAAHGAGAYFQVDYPPSAEASGLQLGVTYTLWIPSNVPKLRGVIVHQHGAGRSAAAAGAVAAYDLHWQALARKWNCALLGPSYHVLNDSIDYSPGGAELWYDPGHGSEKAFLRGLADLAVQSGHPEVATVPWCLWGHSGGGIWSSIMELLHPDRVVAAFFRSGNGFTRWERGEIPRTPISSAAMQVPMMAAIGNKEKGEGAWVGTVGLFKLYREKGAPIGFAADPRTGHECGDSRYLAIPFFDACLAMRLPDEGSADQALKPVDLRQSWLAIPTDGNAVPATQFVGNVREAAWLPNEAVAKVWTEYVRTGEVGDCTPPAGPFDLRATPTSDGKNEITWDAEPDLESGIGGFIILRDGRGLVRLPLDPPQQLLGRPLFQGISFHDTPEQPLPEMRFVDMSSKSGEKHTYTVVTLNGAGIPSVPTAVSVP